MALSKMITYDNGTTASYHRIDGLLVCCHPDNGATVTATLYSYLRGAVPSSGPAAGPEKTVCKGKLHGSSRFPPPSASIIEGRA